MFKHLLDGSKEVGPPGPNYSLSRSIFINPSVGTVFIPESYTSRQIRKYLTETYFDGDFMMKLRKLVMKPGIWNDMRSSDVYEFTPLLRFQSLEFLTTVLPATSLRPEGEITFAAPYGATFQRIPPSAIKRRRRIPRSRYDLSVFSGRSTFRYIRQLDKT